MDTTTTRQAPTSAGQRCSVDGCGGTLTSIRTGNAGGSVLGCPFCEKRKQWAIENVPGLPPEVCAICGGPTPKTKGGRGSRHLKHCKPCAGLLKIKWYRDKVAARKSAPATKGRTTAKAGR